MRENIIKLRLEGKTYNEIVQILGCSKSTVCYHLDNTQKDKTIKRTSHYRNGGKNLLRRDIPHYFRRSIINFKTRSSKNIPNVISKPFSIEDAYDKFSANPVCYLTGRNIDLNDTSTYSLDYIMPFSKGGTNSLDNLGICHPDANMAKAALELNEFYSLCEEILDYRNKND